jgi:DNA polymerase I-like protein with 3'-5' exonuclease and polymerase domains
MPISADYSQIELRVWRTAGDETLIEAFRRGTMTTIRRR